MADPKYQQFVEVGTQQYPKGGKTVLIPDRNVNHPGDFPTVIPETWADATSPFVEVNTPRINSDIAANPLTFVVGVAFLFWAPRDRLSANAYAQLPVRGT